MTTTLIQAGPDGEAVSIGSQAPATYGEPPSHQSWRGLVRLADGSQGRISRKQLRARANAVLRVNRNHRGLGDNGAGKPGYAHPFSPIAVRRTPLTNSIVRLLRIGGLRQNQGMPSLREAPRRACGGARRPFARGEALHRLVVRAQ
jgi:hypothetical protein